MTPVGIFLPATDDLLLDGVSSKVTSDGLVERLAHWWEAQAIMPAALIGLLGALSLHFSPALGGQTFKHGLRGYASDKLLMHPGDQMVPMRALDFAARVSQRHMALPFQPQARPLLTKAVSAGVELT